MVTESKGVGTELAKLIPTWAVQFAGKCNCKDMEKKMNNWGPDGCEARRDVIVKHLTSQKDHLVPFLQLVPSGLRKVACDRMLSLAIRNARKEP